MKERNRQRPGIDPQIRSVVEKLEGGETYLSEAEFGYAYVKDYLDACPANARVLEIGSGPCVLLSQIKMDFPALEVTGVEPLGSGFGKLEIALQEMTDAYDIDLVRSGYEILNHSTKIDFIFSVNVFEHLKNWLHFIDFVGKKLKPGGKCLILCPNYNFPYESHFGLPIVINKQITYSLFKSRIDRHENEQDCAGLWDSLNFVKWSRVRKYLAKKDLEVKFNNTMLREMIERLSYDKEFEQRQKSIALLARLMMKLGVVRLFEFPVFWRFHPYMHLEITSKSR